MIGEALYNLFSTHASLLAIHEGRVSPVMFDQDTEFPAMFYNTKSLKRIECRVPSATREGLVQLGLIARDSVGIEAFFDTVCAVLDEYVGEHEGYLLHLSLNDDDFDESDPDLGAFYKAVYFDLTATQL